MLPVKNKLSTFLHNAPCSSEILEFYRNNSGWFNERRLRRFVFHTSVGNDHLVLPKNELFRYAARLLSMEEAFLDWFGGLSASLRNFVVLLVRHPVLSAAYAYKASGILEGNLSDARYKSFSKAEILADISQKQKYILENIAVHKGGFVYCPALFRRYIASHLSVFPEFRDLAENSFCLPDDFQPVSVEPDFFNGMDNIIEEKLKSARTLKDAVAAVSSAPNSFDAKFLVPHLHLSARHWNSPETTRRKIQQVDSVLGFLQSPLFEKPVCFSSIENSFSEELLSCVPEFYIPAEGNGCFVSLKTEKTPNPRLNNSSCFGKRLELAGGDFLHSFVSVPAFNNLLLILCCLGFFECTLEPNPGCPVHNALLYPLGKIAAVKRVMC